MHIYVCIYIYTVISLYYVTIYIYEYLVGWKIQETHVGHLFGATWNNGQPNNRLGWTTECRFFNALKLHCRNPTTEHFGRFCCKWYTIISSIYLLSIRSKNCKGHTEVFICLSHLSYIWKATNNSTIPSNCIIMCLTAVLPAVPTDFWGYLLYFEPASPQKATISMLQLLHHVVGRQPRHRRTGQVHARINHVWLQNWSSWVVQANLGYQRKKDVTQYTTIRFFCP